MGADHQRQPGQRQPAAVPAGAPAPGEPGLLQAGRYGVQMSGRVTYFNKTGIKNPTLPDGSIAPLLDFQASFLDADGAIIGFAKVDMVDMVDGPTGTTINVRE